MKVTLVYPNIIPSLAHAHYDGHYSHGVGILSAVMKKENHQVSLIHITRDIAGEEFCERVRAENPDLLVITCTSNQFPLVERLISYLRQHNINILTICGGPHVTLNPDDVINNPNIDIVCIGEGERALVSLCSKLERGEDYSRINNLWVRWKGEVVKNPLSSYIDLNKLPFADRAIFPNLQNLFNERHGRASMMASRGCPYKCTYCCNHAIRKVKGARNYIRYRSVKHLIDELATILADYSFINSFHFVDDIFCLDKKWFYEFSSIYRAEIGRPYSCLMRLNHITEETVKMLAESGCDMVQVGIESGNEVIRNRVLKRGLSNESMVKAFDLCKAAGIKILSLNMVGIPFESPSAVLDTIKMNSRTGPDSMEVSIFYPYKGTELYDVCKKENYLTKRDELDYFADSILSLPDLSREQIIMFRKYFRRLVRLYGVMFKYKGKGGRYGIQLIDRILSINSLAWVMVGSYPVLHWLWLKVTKQTYRTRSYATKINCPDE